MKNIIIKSLDISNFKGIKKFAIEFDKTTNIFGANGTGKTTIADSFFWLLFGKDSKDKADFSVLPLDENNKVVHHLVTSVQATLEVDGNSFSIKRVIEEKWTKKQMQVEKVLEGTISTYFINELPVKKKEYDQFIYNIVDDKTFKLLTNINNFNSLKWSDKRALLMEMVEDVTTEDILNSDKELEPLRAILQASDNLDNLVLRTKRQIKEAKTERDKIPVRIDEVYSQIKDCGNNIANNFRKGNVEKLIKEIEEKIQKNDNEAYKRGLEQELFNAQKVLESKQITNRNKLINTKHNLESQLRDIKDQIREEKYSIGRNLDEPKRKLQSEILDQNNQVIKIENKLNTLRTKAMNIEFKMEKVQNEIDSCIAYREALINKFNEIKSRKFEYDPETMVCPTCKRGFTVEDMEAKITELENNFICNNAAEQKDINEQGKANNSKKEELEKTYNELKESLEALANEIGILDGTKKQYLQAINENNKKLSTTDKTNLAEITSDKIEELENGVKAILTKIKELDNAKFDYTEDNKAIESLKSKINDIDTNSIDKLREDLRAAKESYDKVVKEVAIWEANESLKARVLELQAEEEVLSQKIATLELNLFLAEKLTRKKINLMEAKINDKFKYCKFKLFNELVNGGIEETCEATFNGVPFKDLNTASQIKVGLDIINTLNDKYKICCPIILDNRESVTEIIETNSQVINLFVSKEDKQLRKGE